VLGTVELAPLLRSWADGLRDQLSRIYAHDDTHPLAA
jgi:hypothetical protein